MNSYEKINEAYRTSILEGKGTKMICNECGAKFTKKIGPKTTEVKCPKCGGYDTEPA